MTDNIKSLVERLRSGNSYCDAHIYEAADLIEQQAARIAELEARSATPVCYAVSIEVASAQAKERTSLDTCTKRGGAYDTPLFLAAPVADSAMAKDAERYREAIAAVCEGWTLPDGARKILETALWSQIAASEPKNTGN